MRRIAILAALSLLFAAPATAQAPAEDREFASVPFCDEVDGVESAVPERARQILAARNACLLRGLPSVQEALAIVGQDAIGLQLRGEEITVVLRASSRPRRLCCSLQAEPQEIARGLWGFKARLKLIDKATLSFYPQEEGAKPLRYRGPEAQPRPAFAEALEGQLLEPTLASRQLGEVRQLTVYLPPGHDRAKTYPLLVMGDGAWLKTYAGFLDPLIASGELPPFVALGVDSGPRAILGGPQRPGRNARAADYLPGYEGDRFDRHLAFVADEAIPWMVATYGASARTEERIVSGASQAGVFAMHAAYRRPDVFGHALAFSPGFKPIDAAGAPRPAGGLSPRFFFSAGLYEAPYWLNAKQSAEALAQAGYRTAFMPFAAGHDHMQWELAFLAGLKAALATPEG